MEIYYWVLGIATKTLRHEGIIKIPCETLCPSAFVAFVFLHCSEFLLISYEGLHWLKKIKKIGNEVLDQLPRYRLLDALLSMLIDLLRSATPITDYRIPDY